MLITVARQLSPLAELTGVLAARLKHSPSQIINLTRVRKSTDEAATKTPVASNADVLCLKEGDMLEFAVSEPPPPAPRPPAPAPVAEIGYPSADYIKEHWVSASAGYYAVVGKMPPDEENRLLLDIVSAFSPLEDLLTSPAISCEESARITSTAAPRGLEAKSDPSMSYIPADLIHNPWDPAFTTQLRIFTADEIRSAFEGNSAIGKNVCRIG